MKNGNNQPICDNHNHKELEEPYYCFNSYSNRLEYKYDFFGNRF